MKGVILSICPDARLIDICHEVPSGNIGHGSLVLESLSGYFPPGTIHVAVVDPGVGSQRRPIAIEAGPDFWIAPDNGLLSAVLDREPEYAAFALTNCQYHRDSVSTTFHGRDIFAPIAGHLASGVALKALGERVSNLVRINLPRPRFDGDQLQPGVSRSDHFGNLITNLHQKDFDQWQAQHPGSTPEVIVQDRSIGLIQTTFSDVEPGQAVTYFGSAGYLEIAFRNGNAKEMFGSSPEILIRRGKSPR